MSVSSELGSLLSAAITAASLPFEVQVQAGEPDVVNLPTLAYWFTGIRTWEANTMSVTEELQDWRIQLYIPVGPVFVPQSGTIEGWLVTIADAIRGQLYGHVGLNGAATGEGCLISDTVTGWTDVGSQKCRLARMDLSAMLSAVHPIAV